MRHTINSCPACMRVQTRMHPYVNKHAFISVRDDSSGHDQDGIFKRAPTPLACSAIMSPVSPVCRGRSTCVCRMYLCRLCNCFPCVSVAAGVPVVVHNGTLDLPLLLNHLRGAPLPAKWPQYKTLVRKCAQQSQSACRFQRAAISTNCSSLTARAGFNVQIAPIQVSGPYSIDESYKEANNQPLDTCPTPGWTGAVIPSLALVP
jgi:hypothetical protein